MRVLMVTPRFAPFTGGIETHTYEVARRLSAQGVETSILTCDPTGDLPNSDVRDGFNANSGGVP